MSKIKDIAELVAPYKQRLLWNFFFNVLNSFFSLFTFLGLVPFLYILFRVEGGKGKHLEPISGWLDAYIAEHGQWPALALMCAFIMTTALLKNLVNYLSLLSIAHIRTAVSRDLRDKLYRKILELPVAYFSGERKGDIISRMTNDLMEIEFSVIGTLEALLKSPVMIILSLVTLFVISWKLTVFALIFLPLSGFLISRIAKSLKNAAHRGKSSLDDLISHIDETISGIRIVQVFNAKKAFQHRFTVINHSYFRLMHGLYRKEYLSSPMSEFISLLVISILLLFGGRIVIAGEMGGEMLIGYLVVFAQVIAPARAFSDAIFKLNKGAASLEGVKEILNAPETVVDAANARACEPFAQQIEFRNIQFGYHGDPVIRGVSFTVPMGKTVALVGPSGSGKTTLASLLARYYDPQQGQVLLDGYDIRQITLNSLRSQIGFVSQDAVLFNDSIRNNIALGQEIIDEERLRVASREANAEEFISRIPESYEYRIGDGGNKLSGGQRQRLAIARALYRNPPILILDEATSALDNESEKLVQDALFNLMENRTCLVIAHRLSTVQRADEILVLDKGSIIERGNHSELMALQGLYYRLVQAQDL